jgi:translation initiation factor 3 subunit I
MGGRIALFTTDATMGNTSELNIVEIADDPSQRASNGLPGFESRMETDAHFVAATETDEIILTIRIPKPKATIARWGAMNKVIFTGHEDGTVTQWDPEVGF